MSLPCLKSFIVLSLCLALIHTLQINWKSLHHTSNLPEAMPPTCIIASPACSSCQAFTGHALWNALSPVLYAQIFCSNALCYLFQMNKIQLLFRDAQVYLFILYFSSFPNIFGVIFGVIAKDPRIFNRFYFLSVDAVFQEYVDGVMTNKIKIHLSIFLDFQQNLISFLINL